MPLWVHRLALPVRPMRAEAAGGLVEEDATLEAVDATEGRDVDAAVVLALEWLVDAGADAFVDVFADAFVKVLLAVFVDVFVVGF